ncbi:TetR/AcrR family transcriptional regulator [Phenylobacterium deserti]|uniref:TetR/AcrR family transcriptional regulator n=1 Tax=Phenylobacterium deserti TaxID=1914756 RepID=A0A328AS83_9CAUL|nr:TetR/AcrR family transcriptional regulator [Phenylobacterium deserti]RAK57820.1 TetR/AcrR family transcriptional regulator [Phenylobacterium deserti]
MSSEDSGADHRRSIELLWGRAETGRRGPKPRLSVTEVVAAGVKLADEEGVAAISMRRVAEAVGLSPMALYTYAPSKIELIDLMLDAIWGEMQAPGPELAHWRDRMEFFAKQHWALGRRHPWMLQVGTHRPPLGPNVLAMANTAFGMLDGLGLSGVEIDQLMHLVADYVRGALRTALEADDVERITGITDEQWWQMHEPLLGDLIDRGDFPHLVRVGAEVKTAYRGQNVQLAHFEFGLQRVLDGVEAYIAKRATSGDR